MLSLFRANRHSPKKSVRSHAPALLAQPPLQRLIPYRALEMHCGVSVSHFPTAPRNPRWPRLSALWSPGERAHRQPPSTNRTKNLAMIIIMIEKRPAIAPGLNKEQNHEPASATDRRKSWPSYTAYRNRRRPRLDSLVVPEE